MPRKALAPKSGTAKTLKNWTIFVIFRTFVVPLFGAKALRGIGLKFSLGDILVP